MAIFYVDYENGADANNGTSWATAFKTLQGATSAKGVAPGDEIRIAKSPASVSIGNATWTRGSATVTLAAAKTAAIHECEVIWTNAGASSTGRDSNVKKVGSYSCRISTLTTDTGLLSYRAITETDFSDFTKITLWLRANAVYGSVFKICLCSDASGATVVDEFVVPALLGTNTWRAVTIAKTGGGNLGASIQSIAVYAASAAGANASLYLDHIMACNDLSLTSLISKKAADSGEDELFWPVLSITGASVVLAKDPNGVATSFYQGTTETVESFSREPIKTAIVASGATVIQYLEVSGAVGQLIEFKGGYNPATGDRDGETIFSGQNGYGIGIRTTTKDFVKLSRLGFYNCYNGVELQSGANNYLEDITAAGNSNNGVSWSIYSSNALGRLKTFANAADGLSLSSYGSILDNVIAQANGSYDVNIIAGIGNIIKKLTCGLAAGSSYSGLRFHTTAMNKIFQAWMEKIFPSWGPNYISRLEGLLADPAIHTTYYKTDMRTICHDYENTQGNHWIFADGGALNYQTAMKYTGVEGCWRFAPLSTQRCEQTPLALTMLKVACVANKEVTVKGWFRRSHTGLTMRLAVRNCPVAGVDDDAAAMTAAADTWEQLTLTLTPTEAGVVEIEAQTYGGTTYVGHVSGPWEVTQAS